MKAQIFMLGFFLTFMSFALPECRAWTPLNQTNTQEMMVLSSSQLEQTMTQQLRDPSVVEKERFKVKVILFGDGKN